MQCIWTVVWMIADNRKDLCTRPRGADPACRTEEDLPSLPACLPACHVTYANWPTIFQFLVPTRPPAIVMDLYLKPSCLPSSQPLRAAQVRAPFSSLCHFLTRWPRKVWYRNFLCSIFVHNNTPTHGVYRTGHCGPLGVSRRRYHHAVVVVVVVGFFDFEWVVCSTRSHVPGFWWLIGVRTKSVKLVAVVVGESSFDGCQSWALTVLRFSCIIAGIAMLYCISECRCAPSLSFPH